jgi:hypothetical protein
MALALGSRLGPQEITAPTVADIGGSIRDGYEPKKAARIKPAFVAGRLLNTDSVAAFVKLVA